MGIDQIQSVAVVMVPLPLQSHLNQLLHISALISASGIPVHYVGSATHNRQARLRAALKPDHNIHFHDFPTPPLTLRSDLNAENSYGRIPVHLFPAFSAYKRFRRPVAALVRELAAKTKRVVVVFDQVVAEAADDAVSIPNVECYAFHIYSAFNLFHLFRHGRASSPADDEDDENDDFISMLPYSIDEVYPKGTLKALLSKPPAMRERAGDILNTTRAIDGRYFSLLEREAVSKGRKLWAIRPNIVSSPTIDSMKTRPRCLEWLDRQPPRSVVYASFGSGISLSNEEARELATALERSHHKFIWVFRSADGADIFSGGGKVEAAGLPEGFEERVRERGMVVRDWAPQSEILAHKSTGAFVSHCGWNSCLESLAAGVPIAAWPMHTDQPTNAVLLTRVLKVGVLVREWAEREKVVEAAAIENAVVKLMASEEGGEMRKRAEELSAAMREGGVCGKELASFIAHITR